MDATSPADFNDAVASIEEIVHISGCTGIPFRRKSMLVMGVCKFIIVDRMLTAQNQLRCISFANNIFKYFCSSRFEEGLSTLGVLASMRSVSSVWKAALSARPEMTADKILDLYADVSYSPRGSNKRVVEEVVITNWRDYVLELAGMT